MQVFYPTCINGNKIRGYYFFDTIQTRIEFWNYKVVVIYFLELIFEKHINIVQACFVGVQVRCHAAAAAADVKLNFTVVL